jgi:hypothetical protein
MPLPGNDPLSPVPPSAGQTKAAKKKHRQGTCPESELHLLREIAGSSFFLQEQFSSTSAYYERLKQQSKGDTKQRNRSRLNLYVERVTELIEVARRGTTARLIARRANIGSEGPTIAP